jgi:tRNA(Ile)-lysidine synthase
VLARAVVAPGIAGDALIDADALRAAPEELRLRLLADTLGWVSGAVWRPRLAPLAALDAVLMAGGPGRGITLHGCVIRERQGRVAVRREPAWAAAPVPAGTVWDGRWELAEGSGARGLVIGALGRAGLAQCPDWRATGIARETLLTTPALWRGDRLEAAPFAREGTAGGFRRISTATPLWMTR